MAYTELTQFNSPNHTPGAWARSTYGLTRAVEGITIHWWGDPNQNPTFNNVVNYLCRKGGNTSAHVVATGTGRQVAWIVNAGDVAWHTGNARGNARTIGIELDPRCRDEDYDVGAELIANIWRAYGKVQLYRHSDWIATACPGNYDIDRLRRLAEAKLSGEEEEVKIGAGDNWRSRMNRIHHQLVRNGDMNEEVFKSIQGQDAWKVVESWSDHPESTQLIQDQELGEVARTQDWRGQILNSQKALEETNKKLSELSALPETNEKLQRELEELRAKNALLISKNAEYETKLKEDAEAGEGFLRRIGQLLTKFTKK